MNRKPKDLEIKKESFYNLWITTDYDESGNKCAQLLFTPSKKKFEHYHIDVSAEELNSLKKWIDEFLKEQEK